MAAKNVNVIVSKPIVNTSLAAKPYIGATLMAGNCDVSNLVSQQQLQQASGVILAQALSQTGVVSSINNLSGIVYITGDQTFEFQNSGQYIFISQKQVTIEESLPTGINNYYVDFHYIFNELPKVFHSLVSDNNYFYVANIENIYLSGVNIGFSDQIRETGVKLYIQAKV